jgi:hypothetical protein
LLSLATVCAERTPEIIAASAQPICEIESDTVADLSGITWLGGASFAAVSDKRNLIQYLRLAIDPATGAITAGELGRTVPVPARGRDFEALAWDSAAKAFYIASEQGSTVYRFTPSNAKVSSLPIPAIFAKPRRNLGLESLTRHAKTGQFWIANEEALPADGPLTSQSEGTLIRLQRLDARFRPRGQYAWRTEPAAFRYAGAGNGVCDLCALDDGRLLVLERGFAGLGLRLRIYLADFSRATDTTAIPALADPAVHFVPTTKTLLYERSTSTRNFEGLTLGPPLAGGWRSLIAIADSNGTPTHSFLALKIRLAK